MSYESDLGKKKHRVYELRISKLFNLSDAAIDNN